MCRVPHILCGRHYVVLSLFARDRFSYARYAGPLLPIRTYVPGIDMSFFVSCAPSLLHYWRFPR